MKYRTSTSNERTCLMYHAAYKVEFQPFKRSYSQLTFFNSDKIAVGETRRGPISHVDRSRKTPFAIGRVKAFILF